MGFIEAVRTCFGKFAGFSGRARRAEYWWFTLFIMIIYLLTTWIDGLWTIEPDPELVPYVTLIVALLLLLPSLAVSIRRLHDTDRSGWWYLISLVPFLGNIILIIFFATRGTNGPNRFGPDPLG